MEKDQGKKEEPNRSWSDFPPNLLCLVSSYLFAGDFITFRSVCNSWRSSTCITQPVPPILDHAPQYCRFPCLMSTDHHECRFYHPTYNWTSLMEIPELLGSRILFSKYGWLLLTRDYRSVFFYSPYTRAKVELPPLPAEWKPLETLLCFSSSPTSSDCFVLGLMDIRPGVFVMIKRGEKSWASREIAGQHVSGISNCNPVLYKGLCYCLDWEARIAVFDPNGNPSEWTVYAASRTPLPRDRFVFDDDRHNAFVNVVRQSFMVESGEGKIILVAFMKYDNAKAVYVYETNLSNLPKRRGLNTTLKVTWRRVRSLRKKTLHISMGGSFLEPVEATEAGNKIYLPMIWDKKDIVYYDLHTELFQSFGGDYSSKRRANFHVKELRNCCWIEANRQSTLNGNNQVFEW